MLSKAALAAALGAGLIAVASAQTVGATGAQGMTTDQTTPTVHTGSMNTWMTDYSKKNQGRISRDAYMAEAGRNWDAMDKNKRGLTTDEINGMYGYGPGMKPNAAPMGGTNGMAGTPGSTDQMNKDKPTK